MEFLSFPSRFRLKLREVPVISWDHLASGLYPSDRVWEASRSKLLRPAISAVIGCLSSDSNASKSNPCVNGNWTQFTAELAFKFQLGSTTGVPILSSEMNILWLAIPCNINLFGPPKKPGGWEEINPARSCCRIATCWLLGSANCSAWRQRFPIRALGDLFKESPRLSGTLEKILEQMHKPHKELRASGPSPNPKH